MRCAPTLKALLRTCTLLVALPGAMLLSFGSCGGYGLCDDPLTADKLCATGLKISTDPYVVYRADTGIKQLVLHVPNLLSTATPTVTFGQGSRSFQARVDKMESANLVVSVSANTGISLGPTTITVSVAGMRGSVDVYLYAPPVFNSTLQSIPIPGESYVQASITKSSTGKPSERNKIFITKIDFEDSSLPASRIGLFEWGNPSRVGQSEGLTPIPVVSPYNYACLGCWLTGGLSGGAVIDFSYGAISSSRDFSRRLQVCYTDPNLNAPNAFIMENLYSNYFVQMDPDGVFLVTLENDYRQPIPDPTMAKVEFFYLDVKKIVHPTGSFGTFVPSPLVPVYGSPSTPKYDKYKTWDTMNKHTPRGLKVAFAFNRTLGNLGRLDLAFMAPDKELAFFKYDPGTNYMSPSNVLDETLGKVFMGQSGVPLLVRLTDIDRDGLLDVAMLLQEGPTMRLCWVSYLGDSRFSPVHSVDVYVGEASAARSADLGDLNGDGKIDLLILYKEKYVGLLSE